MSLTAREQPKWEHKTKPRTGVREYTIEVSKEVFWKMFVLVKGKNAALDSGDPDKNTVSSQAESILRTWLDTNYPTLSSYWDQHIDAEEKAIDFVKDTQAP